MPRKATRKTYSAVEGRKWYKENKNHKIAYEKAKGDEHLARYYSKKKMGFPKGKDVHHIDGNPKNNSKSNLSVVRPYHSKGSLKGKSKKK